MKKSSNLDLVNGIMEADGLSSMKGRTNKKMVIPPEVQKRMQRDFLKMR